MNQEIIVIDPNNLPADYKLAVKNGNKAIKRANKQIKSYHSKSK